MSNIAEFESILSLENPIKSSVVPRWQRKQQQSANSTLSDRFIPTRAAGLNSSDADMSLTTNNAVTGIEENEEYAKAVAQGLLGNEEKEARILAYKQKPPMPQDGYQNSMKVLYSQAGKKNEVVRSVRQIPSAPIRVLDAPDLLDDYCKHLSNYSSPQILKSLLFIVTDLNLLSWSCNNTLAVALSQTVYLWDAATGSIKDLMSVESEPEDYISSVAWIQEGGTHLAIGTNSNTVQMWDAVVGKKVRSLAGHSSRVGALAWNGHILSSGSRDTTIMTHDVRVANHVVGVLRNHTQEVCGLSWSPDGAYLASGANDNTLCIYDAASTLSFNGAAKHVITDHQAAVKALAWSPHERNLLVRRIQCITYTLYIE